MAQKIENLTWNFDPLMGFLKHSLLKIRRQKHLAGDRSPFWIFIHDWPKEKIKCLLDFMAGTYHFEPLTTYVMPDETITVWSYIDRLFIKSLLQIIKPFFKHIISPNCFHLKGPNGVKNALGFLNKAWDKETFRYFLRVDIKSYYASINHQILVSQIRSHFKDPRVVKYLEDIKNAVVFRPNQGIPRRSSFSCFFGALYLSPLDSAFEGIDGVCYVRYMDDILILTRTKRQFRKEKKRLQKILQALKLKVARTKTKIGILTRGFHFLGVNFRINEASSPEEASITRAVAQTQQAQFQEEKVSITLHERSCVRAMDKIRIKKEDSEPPENVQRYLSKWASWWYHAASPILRSDCLILWVKRALRINPSLAWLGTGLLPRSKYYAALL
ncbi:MAG TPA: reverse transcriptase domain-containing protein [Gammaproteobacteria bacterium]|nr:reverse transcriptase domain-containing protein [Gammaproteobacteria bacterium]